MKTLNRYLFAVLLLLLSVSCSRTPAPKQDMSGIFEGPQEALIDFDPAVVRGKTIVIDPGHGGRYTGAIGPQGTREADVNLNVARYLHALLLEHGANPILTRTSDRDFVPPGGRLSDDLQARVDLASTSGADLFVSIHHNASGAADPLQRRIETYYKMTDDGPSLDFAQFVHRHLVRNLGIPEHRIVPGNFQVLRNNPLPAVLGEATYLSNPLIEAKLRLPENQRLEAYAYFLGIVDYFMAGLPTIDIISPAKNERLTQSRPLILADLRDEQAGIDPASIQVRLNGEHVGHHYEPAHGRLTVTLLDPLPNQQHQLDIMARNLNGNAAMRRTQQFTTELPAHQIELTPTPATLHDGLNRITARVTDVHGQGVLDSTRVYLTTPAGDTLDAFTHGGQAHFYFEWNGANTMPMMARCQDVSAQVVLHHDQKAQYQHVHISSAGEWQRPVFLREGTFLHQADRNGHLWLSAGAAQDWHVTCDGFFPQQIPSHVHQQHATQEIALEPVFGGALHGRRIMLDPECGGEEDGTTGPTGVQAADVNFKTARHLALLLTRAGAIVAMTRDADRTVPLSERVRMSSEFGAERHLVIAHGKNETPQVVHYPDSFHGTPLARAIAAKLQANVSADTRYMLRQTACAAAYIQFGNLADPHQEVALAQPPIQRYHAYRILQGLATHFGHQATVQLDGLVFSTRNQPVAGALVVLDGIFELQTNERGEFSFIDQAAGSHTIDIFYKNEKIRETVVLPLTERRVFYLGESAF